MVRAFLPRCCRYPMQAQFRSQAMNSTRVRICCIVTIGLSVCCFFWSVFWDNLRDLMTNERRSSEKLPGRPSLFPHRWTAMATTHAFPPLLWEGGGLSPLSEFDDFYHFKMKMMHFTVIWAQNISHIRLFLKWKYRQFSSRQSQSTDIF